jgi:hypothetical protein
LVGKEFIIKDNRGSFIFKGNKIANGKQTSEFQTAKNVFINNENAVFQDNTYKSDIQIELQ